MTEKEGLVQVADLKLVDTVAEEMREFGRWQRKRQEEYAEKTYKLGARIAAVQEELGWKGITLLAEKIDYHPSTLLRWASWSKKPWPAVSADLKRGIGSFEQMRLMEGKQARKGRLLDNAEKTLNELHDLKEPEDESAYMLLREALKHDVRSELLGILGRIATAKKPDNKFKLAIYEELDKLVKKAARLHKADD